MNDEDRLKNAKEGAFQLLAILKERDTFSLLPFSSKPTWAAKDIYVGAAETLSVKIYRTAKAKNLSPLEATNLSLSDYQHPVSLDILRNQIQLAVNECTDIEFIPLVFRHLRRA